MVFSTFVFIAGCLFVVVYTQALPAHPLKVFDELPVFDVPKHKLSSVFAGVHQHPVLMRMKEKDYKHVLSDDHHFMEKPVKRDGMFGNFDPNKFNAQVGASFNPNTFSGGSGSTSTGGMSMFNPNAMMGGGSGSGGMGSMFSMTGMMGGGGTSGTQQGSGQSQPSGGSSQSGSGTSSGSSTFDPNVASGTSSGSAGSSSSGSGGMPHYDPNNIINTGAKYDPNAANSGMGGASGGSSPAFTNGMGMNAQQQLSPAASNWTGSGSGSGSGSGPSAFGSAASGSGSQSSGSSGTGQSPGSSSGSSSGTFDPNNFGSSSSSGSSGGSGSSAPSAFGSSSGGGAQSQTGSQPQSQTGSQHQSQSGSTGSSFGGASQTGGATGGNAGTFDPIKANSMATSGFNPLNPMLGKDMSQMMGPQAQTGAKGPGNFDPGAVNTQMGANGMNLNMFGGAGGNTDLSKADASSLMGGAQGMMTGSNAINQGGNAFMSGGSQSGGGGGGSGQTGGSGSGFGQTGGSSSSGSSGMNFDPNQMMGGGGSGSSSGGGGMSMFNPSAMMGGGSSGGTGSSSGSGGMNMFDPNAMMGGGSVNPMMPGGNMNPMMPGGSMTGSGSTSGNRNSGNSILDPMGAMTGNARNFSGGNSLIDPMGFMNGGGLSGSMTNMFNPSGRSVPILGTDRLRRETPQLNWRHGNFYNTATGQVYNPMDPMGFIFAGNNKQYTKGNGVDTPGFDPDRYSYTYAGVNFQSFPMMPSTGGAFIPSYQNFHQNVSMSSGTTDNNKGNGSTTTGNAESGQPVDSSPGEGFNTEGLIESFQKMLSSTNMYPHAAYSGVPGMLGTGSQTQNIPVGIPSPVTVGQYISPSLENLTETEPPLASYSGLPGMEGVGSQVQGSITNLEIMNLPQAMVLKQTEYGQIMNSTGSNNPETLYSGFPGILGTGSSVSQSHDGSTRIQTFGALSSDKTNAGNEGHSNVETYNHDFSHPTIQNTDEGSMFGQSSYGMDTVKQTNVNSWNGDWPSGTSDGMSFSKSHDWSGAWSENWPKDTTTHETSLSSDKSGQSSTDFGNSNHIASKATTWGGSWPDHSSETSNRQTASSEHSESQYSSEGTIEALRSLISHLNNFPSNVLDRKEEPSNSRSYTDLVGNWKKELGNNK